MRKPEKKEQIRKELVGVRLSPELLERILALGKHYKMNKSEIIVYILEQGTEDLEKLTWK